jgi:hypothetical protein
LGCKGVVERGDRRIGPGFVQLGQDIGTGEHTTFFLYINLDRPLGIWNKFQGRHR